jgi:hypothetical protein
VSDFKTTQRSDTSPSRTSANIGRTAPASEPYEPATGRLGLARSLAVGALIAVVLGIIAVAFRGSWGALRDAALACHFDHNAADLYPWGVDGLLIVAILAGVLLRHDRGARWYTLGIIATYTAASWIVNFLHGLGVFSPDPATGVRPVPAWPVVVVVASLVIGSIFLGSHMLIYVIRELFPTSSGEQPDDEAYQPAERPDEDATPATPPPWDVLAAATAAYRHSLTPGETRLSQKALAERFRITVREARRVQAVVDTPGTGELAEAEPDDALELPAVTGLNGFVPVPDGGGR